MLPHPPPGFLPAGPVQKVQLTSSQFLALVPRPKCPGPSIPSRASRLDASELSVDNHVMEVVELVGVAQIPRPPKPPRLLSLHFTAREVEIFCSIDPATVKPRRPRLEMTQVWNQVHGIDPDLDQSLLMRFGLGSSLGYGQSLEIRSRTWFCNA